MQYQNLRLVFFRELLQCCHPLYLWTYDPDMNLVESNCPEELLLNSLLSEHAHWVSVHESLSRAGTPLIMTNDLGLMWLVTDEFTDGALKNTYILGPFFMYDIAANQIEQELRRKKLSEELRSTVAQFIRKLPVIALNRILEYGVMLHYCITNQTIGIGDIRFYEHAPAKMPETEATTVHGTYAAEKEMVRLVREGDLNYKRYVHSIANTGKIGDIADGTPLRQLKNMTIINIALVSRAAMDGGLPPETGYSLADHYLQATEKSSAFQTIMDINISMQDDFVQRVHHYRQNETLSKPIRVCIEQMHTRMEEELTLEGMAADFGYSTYYLSKKFKKETGCSFKDYLRQIRLERAKFLLTTTDASILEISERLQFCSQSYLSDSFKKAYGVTPTEFREQLHRE